MKHFIFGIGGTLAAVTLHQLSELASIAAALSTVVYMTVCTVKKLRKNPSKKYESGN